MKKLIIATLFSAISATSVQAVENQKTICRFGDKIRVIEVVYTTGAEVPCEVRYSKEEGMTIPWKANNLAGFCEEKAAAFIDKQEAWGWACEAAPTEEPSESVLPEAPIPEASAPEESAPEGSAL